MNPVARAGRVTGALVIGVVLVLAAGCDSSDVAGTVVPVVPPRPPRGAPSDVDVCRLVTPGDSVRVLDRALRPVALEYTAAKVPTLRCDLGRRFGVTNLSVSLALGPISRVVFGEAYGEPAGGDPVFIGRLGQAAFLRTENGQKSLHVLARGSVVSVQSTIDAAYPVDRSSLVQLAQVALSKLPSNPRLASTDSGRRCAQVPLAAVTAAVGAQPSLLSHFHGPDGSVICSWASEPGVAVVRAARAPGQVAAYRAVSNLDIYQRVPLVAVGADVSAVSRADRAGDLMILRGHSVVAAITVMPTPGFSKPTIATTPGERRLAAAVVAALT